MATINADENPKAVAAYQDIGTLPKAIFRRTLNIKICNGQGTAKLPDKYPNECFDNGLTVIYPDSIKEAKEGGANYMVMWTNSALEGIILTAKYLMCTASVAIGILAMLF